MATGTNFPTGLVTRKKFSGSTASADTSRNNASTKFVNKTAVIRCDAQTSETQTNFTLPTNAIVKDVWLNVITVDATETVDVDTQGTSNDPKKKARSGNLHRYPCLLFPARLHATICRSLEPPTSGSNVPASALSEPA